MVENKVLDKVLKLYEELLGEGYLEEFANDYSSYCLSKADGYISLITDNNEEGYLEELEKETKRFSRMLELASK